MFVYKLIAAGSIEEKILAMQERKAALAAGILSEDASARGEVFRRGPRRAVRADARIERATRVKRVAMVSDTG